MSSFGSRNLGVWRGPIATHDFAKRGKDEGRKRKMIGKRTRKGKEEEKERKGKGKGLGR